MAETRGVLHKYTLCINFYTHGALQESRKKILKIFKKILDKYGGLCYNLIRKKKGRTKQ